MISQIDQHLYLGNRQASKNKALLATLGVTHILIVGEELYCWFPEHFKYLKVQVDDDISEDISRFFDLTYNWIERAIEGGGNVFIHCQAGMSRSVTICAAYLIRRRQIRASMALKVIKAQHPVACPNQGFCLQLE